MIETSPFQALISERETGIWRYEQLLPKIEKKHRLTLGEGNTPLVKSRSIGAQLGISSLYFKMESANPTGSYKDRISALGVSRVLEEGKPACVGTSSGNAGSSVAAYAARVGIPYHLLVLERVLETKLKQAMLHGAVIQKIKHFGTSSEVGDKVFQYINKMAEKHNWEVMITAFHYNPFAMEAVKTISFELFEQLGGRIPDAVFAPVGGGGLYTGVYKGFQALKRCGVASAAPAVVCVQSAGCSNIVKAWEQGLDRPAPGDSTSAISGLQVPNPPDGRQVLNALQAGDGWGEAVCDEDVWAWQEKLAVEEGIWCEAASAVSLAGLSRAVQLGRVSPDSTVVCLLTGAGFKDNERTEAMVQKQPSIPLYDIEQLEASL